LPFPLFAAFEGTLNRPEELPGKAGIIGHPRRRPYRKRRASMGILRSVVGYAKARAARRILARVAGGPFSTVLIAAYVGKKAYDMYRGRRVLTVSR